MDALSSLMVGNLLGALWVRTVGQGDNGVKPAGERVVWMKEVDDTGAGGKLRRG